MNDIELAEAVAAEAIELVMRERLEKRIWQVMAIIATVALAVVLIYG